MGRRRAFSAFGARAARRLIGVASGGPTSAAGPRLGLATLGVRGRRGKGGPTTGRGTAAAAFLHAAHAARRAVAAASTALVGPGGFKATAGAVRGRVIRRGGATIGSPLIAQGAPRRPGRVGAAAKVFTARRGARGRAGSAIGARGDGGPRIVGPVGRVAVTAPALEAAAGGTPGGA